MIGQGGREGPAPPGALVLDWHPEHVAKRVAQFVQAQRGWLESQLLPGYAPDLNLHEFVWNHLRHKGVTKTPLRKDKCLHARVDRDPAKIKTTPSLKRSFFHAASVAYGPE
jgi:hypothetical protein